jgi:hypothetical protein
VKNLRKESLSNVIHEGIKRGIEVLLEKKCYGSAVILIYAGIDAMAFLGMPANRQDVTSHDFITWAEKHIRFERTRNEFRGKVVRDNGFWVQGTLRPW